MAPPVIKRTKWAYGWHWRSPDGSLGYSDGRQPKVGERIMAKGMRGNGPRWCKAGFHAAPSLDDAIRFKHNGALLSFVLMEDCQVYGGWSGRPKNKFTAKFRTILWEDVVPDSISLTPDLGEAAHRKLLSKLEDWLKRRGFKAENLRAKARRLRAKFPKDNRGKKKKV